MTRTDYPLYGKPGVHVITASGAIVWAGVSHHKAAAAWARTVEEHKCAAAEVWHGEARTWTVTLLPGGSVVTAREVSGG